MNPSTTNEGTPLSYGEHAVGITFNVGNDPQMKEVKELYAKIINTLKTILNSEPVYGVPNDSSMKVFSEKGQLALHAIREAQTAQMWAVKAITYKV